MIADQPLPPDGAPQRRGPWLRHSSELVHTNPWYSVRQDRVTRPDGTAGEYYVVVSSPAVFVVALDDQQRAVLVGLHRYTVDRRSLEVPAGSCEPGEEPLDAAQRELAEETGLAAAEWEHLGVLHPANGLLAEDNHVFLARRLSASPERDDRAAEGIDELRRLPLADALALAGHPDGPMVDGQTVAALALAAVRLGLLQGT